MNSDYKFYRERMRELTNKFKMSALQVNGLEDQKDPALETLAERVRQKDKFDQMREGNLCFGHCWSPVADNGTGGPIRIYYSVRK